MSPQRQLRQTAEQLSRVQSAQERLAALVKLGHDLPTLSANDRCPANQVMGCTAQVWLTVEWAGNNAVSIAADSDSSISRGLAAVLVKAFQGSSPAEIDAADIADIEQLALGPLVAAESRTNAFRNMFCALQKRARALTGELPVFPTLLVTADVLEPQGLFAEAQARFLQPDTAQVDRLAQALRHKQVGVVAHFYMDPQVQGVLTSAAEQWPHIAISGVSSSFCCWVHRSSHCALPLRMHKFIKQAIAGRPCFCSWIPAENQCVDRCGGVLVQIPLSWHRRPVPWQLLAAKPSACLAWTS